MTVVMEMAIALESLDDTPGGERKKEGDIVVVRPIGMGVGESETKRYLWFRVDGMLYRHSYDFLLMPNYDPDDPETGVVYDKRRYSVPLERLLTFDPAFDVDRARDLNDLYQPYMVMDEETFEYLTIDPPFDLAGGLVWNKLAGDYAI